MYPWILLFHLQMVTELWHMGLRSATVLQSTTQPHVKTQESVITDGTKGTTSQVLLS